MPQGFSVVRYHSQAATGIPAELEETAWCDGTEGRVVMGVRHRSRPLHGVQFHPESVLTEHGSPAGVQLRVALVTHGGFDWSTRRTSSWPTWLNVRGQFWLDGSGSRPWSGRMTYVGWLEPEEMSVTFHAASRTVLAHRAGSSEQIGDDIFDAMDRLGGESSTGTRSAGWVGFFGYAARTDLPCLNDADPKALDACWLRASRRVAFDHGRRRVFAVCPPELADGWKAELGRLLGATPTADEPRLPPPGQSPERQGPTGTPWHSTRCNASCGSALLETNLTLRTHVASAADPVDTYRRLRRLSPAPYAALITHAGTRVLSSSPERFATIRADRTIEMRPIKGTTARDPDPVRDSAAAERLRTEPKFRGENLMIVDLLRNDLSRVCDVGSVIVTDLMHVESYPSVHQLITTIVGRLRPDVSRSTPCGRSSQPAR